MSAWKLGPTQRLLNLFFQVCFSPLHLHTSLVQKKVQEVFLELTERGERVSKGSPRGQLSTMTPAEAPVRDGRVTEGWPCHRRQQSGWSHSSAVQQRKAGKGVQEGLLCTSPGFSGPCVSSSLGQRLQGLQVSPGAKTPTGPLGKPPGVVPPSGTQGKGRNSSVTDNGQHPVAKEAESRNLP